ncbi:uncharacterized protein BDV17DRAFT_273497 [Aspergillus undulatus]|uniref:uncharacterized protein n=1 Tax=Aspergillus undulatus TaxID=1810928 RepID=UPI003CCCB39E
MFFAGSLQEGISLAVQESKAVICFVPDDGETSSTWQDGYFKGDEGFTKLLETRSVLLRISKDSPEAGFLASVCPITQYPTVVIVRNGMLQEYIVPDVSKEEFRNRITAAIGDKKPETPTAAPSAAEQSPAQSQETNPSPASAPAPVVTAPSSSRAATQTSPRLEQPSRSIPEREASEKGKKPVIEPGARVYSAYTPGRQKEEHKPGEPSSNAKENSQKKDIKGKAPIRITKKEEAADEPSASRPAPTPGPPTQYRLQFRLFDGSSVRSTFSPSHTIRKDIRPWLDEQMEEKAPYNLKLILTPLPNRTLTIAEEEQTLRELVTGSTATFVMVPIRTYIQAYSVSDSLPVRAVSGVYGLATSIVGGAVGYLGSWLGYAQTGASHSQSQTEPRSSESQPSSDNARRRPWGPNIRTLRDQTDGQDSQFYNGNQLNFEPRQDDRR